MARRRDPDRLLCSALHGTAWRLATDRGSIDLAVAELRTLAAGRNDLLTETAGLTAGAWSAEPASCVGTELVVAGLLIFAASPLDYDALPGWVELGRQRAAPTGRPIHG